MAELSPAQKAEALSVSRLKKPADHVEKVKALKRARWAHEREWKLNHAFYKGNQYAFFPKKSRTMISLATEDSEKPRYRVRLVSNQIMPGVRSLVSKLTKTKPVIHAAPSKATEKAARAAQIAERLHEHWWRELNLTAKRNEAWTWAQVCGQGWLCPGWDFNAGKSLTYTIGPDGQPIVNDRLADMFSGMLKEQGIQPLEQTVSLGEVRVDVLSPFDVVLDPSPSDYTECNYAYKIYRLDPDTVYARWGKWVEPDSVSADHDQAIPYDGSDDSLEKNLVTVVIGTFRKTKAMPKGKYVVFTYNEDEFLYEDDWPYPFPEIPLVKFPGIQIPGSVYDRAPVSDARPIQQEFNKTISQIVEFKNLNISPQFIAPAGSMMRNRMTGEPGAIYYYNATSVGGGGKPEAIDLKSLPPYVFEHLNGILLRLREIFQITEVSEGNLPPNLEAGVAIDLLQEIATDALEPQIQQGEMALAQLGTFLLAFAQQYYDEPRIAKLYGSAGSKAEAFMKSDIQDVDIFCEAGSGLPRTRAGRQMRIQRMVDQGLIRPDQAWKHYDMADMKSIAAKFELDEEKAYRENELLIKGIPLNAVAMENIMRAVNTGINPMTGMAIQGPEEVQALLMDAAVVPGPADNHLVEMDVHAMLFKSEEFANFPPEVQRRCYVHYEKHAEQVASASIEPVSPRVTYQIKGTAGPTASADILNRAGVPVTPETMSEPPLETWVTDSMDKPDRDSAGNDPLTQEDLSMIALEQEAEVLRKKSAEADLAEKKVKLASVRNASGAS